MADLKKNSTVGGVPIVTADMINKILNDSGADKVANKMDKIETTLTTPTQISQLSSDTDKNGVYGYSGSAVTVNGPTTSYTKGCILNFTTDNKNGLMQFFSPNNADSSTTGLSELYYKNNSNAAWNLLITKTYLDSKLSGYLKKNAEETSSGKLTINNSVVTNGLRVNNVISSVNYGNTLTIGSYNASFAHFKNSANIPFHFNNDVKVQGEIYAGSTYDKKVWHSGNLTPSNYITKNIRLDEATDVNTVTEPGFYTVKSAVNRPDGIELWGYLEVTNHSDRWILQKMYNFEGTKAYYRTKSDNVWQAWKTFNTGSSFVQEISNVADWTTNTSVNLYEYTVTHNLKSLNVTSVVLTDSSNFSMNIGFRVIDQNKVRVYCADNTTGKIIINVAY